MEDKVKRAKEGDAEALGEIIGMFKYFIFKEASRYHIPAYEYEDIVQHGYLSVIKAVNMYTLGRNSFRGYCLNSIKKNFKALLKGKIKHFREIPNDILLDVNTNQYEFTVEDQVIAYSEVKKLYVALDKLSPQEREIIERFYIINDSLKEIACGMELNYYGAVRLKQKALDKLHKFIE